MDCREHSSFTDCSYEPGRFHAFDLDAALEQVAHWLPTQGPIKDFIHHNTLHAVQHLPFHEGVATAARIFGACSYLPIEDYQRMYRRGRIRDFAIDWALAHSGCPEPKREQLRASLFQPDDSSHYPPVSLANHGIRNAWLTRLELDLNAMVHPVLFRLLGNFLDQGISRWTLPKEGERFWDCVLRLVHNSLLPLYPFNDPDARELLSGTPDLVIQNCLKEIVGNEELYEQYLLEVLLTFPGWAGMVRIVERNPRALLARREISLKEMIATELAIELAFLHKKKGLHFPSIAALPHTENFPLLKDEAFKPKIPLHLKVWQEAMEWSLHCELLLALKPNATRIAFAPSSSSTPEAQALFCIDDRECSVRRYLEEINPSIETFGAAGFFGIDFLYQGLDDAYPVAQCPVVITPKHLIKESGSKAEQENKSKAGEWSNLHFTAHSMFRGWLYTQTLGIGYAARMAWNVFRPGSKLPKIRSLSEVESHSKLHLLRETDEPTEDGYLLGFSFTEMADKVGGLLRNIGLTRNFAPLVVIVAHGSSSVNNPYFAAYDCGACSGKPGAPNARAFAWMANHETVRTLLRERGIDIPDITRFVPALHNTSTDEIMYFDMHLLEQHPASGLHAFQNAMKKALQRNARERCRWFELGPQSPSNKKAHEHVMGRAASIFEPRPEYNHSNNLYCIVGRRTLTQDLFLDRRAFLHSYKAETDPDGTIILGILSALFPVCGGINLEYLFSRIDNAVYGSGTKLPHNVIGLLGVANGVEGDLRTGLPSQMIEVHEPARLLFVVEQTTEILDKALNRLGALKEWVDNEWLKFVSCHPSTHEFFLYSVKGWEAIELPDECEAPSSTHSEKIIVGQTETIPVQKLIRRHA
ncbi:MAG: YbcC family protein [Methylococcales bacterium]